MAGSLPKGIRRRGNSFHVDITRKGVRLTATCHSLLDAQTKKAEFQHKLYSGKGDLEALRKRGKSWTIAEGLEYTARVAWSRAVSRDKMIRMGQEAVAFFGQGRPLNSITTEAIDQWLLTLEAKRLADSSINHRIAAISKIMHVALDRGGLDAIPRMPRRRQYQTRFRIVTKDEETRLLFFMGKCGFELQADAVVTLADTGMRVGELLRLKERDVDLEQNLIHIWQTKTRVPRTAPMTQRVHKTVRKRLTSHPSHRVFPINRYDLYKAWERARSKLELTDDPHFTVNALRHTCASRLVMMGVNLRIVQEWMGHKSYQSTLKYAHLVPETMEKARLALERFGQPPA
jgi:integrase